MASPELQIDRTFLVLGGIVRQLFMFPSQLLALSNLLPLLRLFATGDVSSSQENQARRMPTFTELCVPNFQASIDEWLTSRGDLRHSTVIEKLRGIVWGQAPWITANIVQRTTPPKITLIGSSHRFHFARIDLPSSPSLLVAFSRCGHYLVQFSFGVAKNLLDLQIPGLTARVVVLMGIGHDREEAGRQSPGLAFISLVKPSEDPTTLGYDATRLLGVILLLHSSSKQYGIMVSLAQTKDAVRWVLA